MYLAKREIPRAERLCLRALPILERNRSASYLTLAFVVNYLGMIRYSQDRFTESAMHYQQAVRIIQTVRGPRHIAVAQLLQNVGEAELNAGEYEKSEIHLRESIQLQKEYAGNDYSETAKALRMHAHVLRKLKRNVDARVAQKEAEELLSYTKR